MKNPGYHITEIPKGSHGKSSKIMEELLELIDSEDQHNKIMILNELSDLYLSIENYLNENFPQFSMEDLKEMAKATKRAFRSGRRV